jgi:hypothetical protein
MFREYFQDVGTILHTPNLVESVYHDHSIPDDRHVR